MIEPRDPLPGLDPYPREILDTLWLHQERADLLEDIVSTPGPARSTTTRTRALLAVGIAAAVVIIGGGWFIAASNDGSGDKAPVAAATSGVTTPASSVTPTSTTARATPTAAGTSDRCRRLLTRDHRLSRVLPLLRKGVIGKHGHRARYYVRIATSGRRSFVEVGPGCTLRALRGVRTRH